MQKHKTGVRAPRPYRRARPPVRLVAALLAAGALIVTSGPATAHGVGTIARRGPAGSTGTAAVVVPDRAPERAAEAVTPIVTRLAVGDFTQPAPGVALVEGVPAGVPLSTLASAPALAKARTLTLARASTAPFSAVGITWNAVTDELGAVSVAVRGHVPGGDWGRWQAAGPAEEDHDAHDGASDAGADQAARHPAGQPARDPEPAALRGAADLIWLGPSDGVEIAVTVLSGRAPAGIEAELIDPLDAPGDAVAADPAARPASPVAAPAALTAGVPGAARVAMPQVFRRAAWGAPERQPNFRPIYAPAVKAIAWHHTATANNYAAGDVPRMLRSIYHFQTASRGWSDVGYHVIVDRFGRLWEGRSGGLAKAVVGAHSGGFNTGTAGVAVLGDHRSVPVPAAATEAAARYMAWRFSLSPALDPRGSVQLTGGGSSSRFSPGTTITAPRVFPHRTTNPTECPGARGVDALGTLRTRAAEILGAWSDPDTVRARLATWRPSDARLRVYGAAASVWTGTPGDKPVPADYDGDGVTDPASWTPSTGTWSFSSSVDGAIRQIQWGLPGDKPVPADINGDGKAEPVIFRPASAEWYIHGAAAGVRYGDPTDVPVPADYNGDGRDDIAVWRPSTGMWFMNGAGTFHLGEAWHVPVPADYDGDGAVEPASWSPVTYKWFVKGRSPVKFGDRDDVPVPGQYDGDGRADLAVFHIHSGGNASWRINGIGSYDTGAGGDVPMPMR